MSALEVQSDDSSSESDGEEVPRLSSLDIATVNQHRKGFVKWVNDEFYPKVVKSVESSPLKVYQMLIQKYLGLDTPYRGLLVYHGLGTGKTASAVSLAEGLSSELRINSIVPASLETEFIKEVRRWGLRELHQEGKWFFKEASKLSKDELDQVGELYKLNRAALAKITKKTILEYKKKIIQESDEIGDDLESLIHESTKKIKSYKGFWLPEGSPIKGSEAKLYDSYDPIEQECILQQINHLIDLKYNFIHYRPFPKIKLPKEEGQEEDEEEGEEGEEGGDDEVFPEITEEARTKSQKIARRLEKRLVSNRKKYQVDSPFHKEVIIIDEVHNFVRMIVNKRKGPRIFYNWIVNAEDVKIVFLSGTPIINQPSEIAVLYNMLAGLIKIFTFSVQTKVTAEELTPMLNEKIYESSSTIDMFHVEQKEGVLLVSFIQESSGFESLMDPDNEDKDKMIYTIKSKDSTFDDFISEIYEVLEKVCKKAPIYPLKSEWDNLSKKAKKEIKRGKLMKYDEDGKFTEEVQEKGKKSKTITRLFNRYQKLFDIYENGSLLDMTDNENFVNYFFDSGLNMPMKKRTLLKRMLMGYTSYYPIDRTSIVDMPKIVKPVIEMDEYSEYGIVKKMNVVPCTMSQSQFEKYYEVWLQEKKSDKFRMTSGKGMYNDDAPYHYHTRTRQTCNMIYLDDKFRMGKKTDENKQQMEDDKQRVYDNLLQSQSLRYDKDLSKLSPKMYEIMKQMRSYTDIDKRESKGKILFYSDFKSDAGSDAFALVLRSNGYEKFDYKKPQDTPGLRYTFIRGSESSDERRVNKEFYNDPKNDLGKYVQIMIISSAGAEGLSLTCVRQVHMLEPYWNYVRLDQVLGRAIRMRSHKSLESKERTVEQYLYLSVLPKGTNMDMIYKGIKDEDTWKIPKWDDVSAELSKVANRESKELIESLINININEKGLSVDQYLFQVMESKYNVSLQITSVIQESSLDCIKHTKDTPDLNDRCIRFSSNLQDEIAYFPGITSNVLENIDKRQLRSSLLYHIRPNIYVVSATDNYQEEKKQVGEGVPKRQQRFMFIYYEYDLDKDETKDSLDIRYLRDNAKRLMDIYSEDRVVFKYVGKDHDMNDRLGKEFSVYQEMYELEEEVISEYIDEGKFPSMSKICKDSLLRSYKLQYNIDGTYYVSDKEVLEDPLKLVRMYPYGSYEMNNYDGSTLIPIFLYKEDLYIQDI